MVPFYCLFFLVFSSKNKKFAETMVKQVKTACACFNDEIRNNEGALFLKQKIKKLVIKQIET